MADKSKKMDDSSLLRLVKSEEYSASHYSTERSQAREKSLEYYQGKPLGDEKAGLSQVISWDVFETVEAMMPDLIKVFSTSEYPIEFTATLHDEEGAEAATAYAHHIFNNDNEGFTILYDWIKDGLLSKTGAVKARWVTRTETRENLYEGLTLEELAELLEPKSDREKVDVVEKEVVEDGAFYNVKLRTTVEFGRVEIDCIAPEELLIPRNCRRIDQKTRYLGHKTLQSRSELIELGYDRDKVLAIPSGDGDGQRDGEREARFADEGYGFGDGDRSLEKLSEEVWTTEHFVMVDYDGDGVAERRRVVTGGNKILLNERHDTLPIAAWSPIRVPHRAVGMSIADPVMEIQRIQTALLRGALNNMYLVNNGRMGVNENVNIDDVLNVRPGGVIRNKGQTPIGNNMIPVTTPWVGDKALVIMDHVEGRKEQRTGVTKWQQGIDGSNLHDTATGFEGLLEKLSDRMEMVARLFAEGGLKELYKIILELILKHQDETREILVAGEPITLDPQQWQEQYGIRVNVGTGTGNKEKMIAGLMKIYEMQGGLMQMGLVTPQHIYNTAEKLVRKLDLDDVDDFFMSPESPEYAQLMAMQSKGGEPTNPLVQAEMIKAQSKEREAMMRGQLQANKQQHEQAMAEADKQLEKRGQDQKFLSDMTELELKYRTDVPGSAV